MVIWLDDVAKKVSTTGGEGLGPGSLAARTEHNYSPSASFNRIARTFTGRQPFFTARRDIFTLPGAAISMVPSFATLNLP